MKKRNYIPLSIILGLFSWFADSFIHWLVNEKKVFEIIPSDDNEIWMRSLIFILLVCFGLYANFHTKKIIDKEEETHRVFKATAGASQHILNNFLNEILFFKDEAERVGGFDKKTLKLLEEAVNKATSQLDAMRNVKNLSVKDIKVSIHNAHDAANSQSTN
jgi:hypothetical protein